MPKVYYIFVPKIVLKSMSKIPLRFRERIQKTIDSLAYSPYLGEKMGGVLGDRRKVRVWPYRIIYRIKEGIAFIIIVEVEHRGNVSYD
jgi:mRNA-degrading endonuclease RelE of RelBE toxin-antitoxin system